MKIFNMVAGVIALGAVLASTAYEARAADLYGAIAYSQSSRSYGWAKDFNTQRAAERAALRRCRERANDCRVATWFRNACGALSVGGDGGWGSDWGRNIRAAENKATHACTGYSFNCRIVVSTCISGY
ncbi:MAG: DUF4189 domain-containing protein [Rhizobium sp.]|nr:DUF4189 domain-containing protein [Rhizobium sp.]